jgi:hypothetical protein
LVAQVDLEWQDLSAMSVLLMTKPEDTMTKIQGAVIKEQGVTFAIVIVKSHVLNSSSESEQAATAFSSYFPGMPLVLMAQDSRGTPTYRGRKDIVAFLANISMSRIPWKEYTLP